MAKQTTLYACQKCGAQFQKWLGRCIECGAWGTLSEETHNENIREKVATSGQTPFEIKQLQEIKSEDVTRQHTGMHELNRVLGGGLVPGSLLLLGGEPGIGKSTLALQLAFVMPNSLYISGEESAGQIKLRADRLETGGQVKPGQAKSKIGASVNIANETHVESIVATISKHKPKLAVIDSIQTIYSSDITSEPGSPTQIRACTVKLLQAAKQLGTAICIIGHVTKDGFVAGPKTLEHLVDTVLYLEGERTHAYRILRTVKNRFGQTDEVGIFEMRESGLHEVINPSKHFLEERGEAMSGSVITCLMEGTRPMLVEIQALVNKTSFGYPVRKASGFDLNRLHVLVAVLQKRAGLNLGQYDIHINVVGGIKANEPGADLAVCLAIASSYKDKILGQDLVVFGEVGLGGEIRSIAGGEKRIKESANLGMKRIITGTGKYSAPKNITLIAVKNIEELVKQA